MNISKIAKLASVSPATVSRYLNDGYVSEEKRKKIQKVIEETGYIPSPSARTLRTNKHNLIGVIVPKICTESISEMVEGITAQLKNTDYNILLANTDNSPDKELEFLSIFQKNTVDGVILIGTVLTKKHMEIISEYNKPIVVLGQFHKNISCVYYDDFGASYGCTEKLIESGCTNIAYLGVTLKDKSAGKSRLEGFTSAIENYNLNLNVNLMHESDFTNESGYQAMKKVLAVKERFDGVFCSTDSIALGAMKCLKDYGISVPNDVKIISIGNSDMAELCNPTLSSAYLYYVSGGKEACRMLLDSLNNDTQIVKQHRLGYEIFSRESTQLL